MKDRRRHKRFAIKIPLKWRSGSSSKKSISEVLLFDTHNVTRRGLFLKTNLRAKKGSHIELELNVAKGEKPIIIKGKVVWIAAKRKHSHLYPGIGIEFEKPRRKYYKKLNDYLRKKFENFRDALELKKMYLKLKDMASRLVELEERHSSAPHFKYVIEGAITEINGIAHLLDKEINEVKNL